MYWNSLCVKHNTNLKSTIGYQTWEHLNLDLMKNWFCWKYVKTIDLILVWKVWNRKKNMKHWIVNIFIFSLSWTLTNLDTCTENLKQNSATCLLFFSFFFLQKLLKYHIYCRQVFSFVTTSWAWYIQDTSHSFLEVQVEQTKTKFIIFIFYMFLSHKLW